VTPAPGSRQARRRARFLASAGLGPDDVARELISGLMPDGSTRTVTEHRWSASI